MERNISFDKFKEMSSKNRLKMIMLYYSDKHKPYFIDCIIKTIAGDKQKDFSDIAIEMKAYIDFKIEEFESSLVQFRADLRFMETHNKFIRKTMHLNDELKETGEQLIKAEKGQRGKIEAIEAFTAFLKTFEMTDYLNWFTKTSINLINESEFRNGDWNTD